MTVTIERPNPLRTIWFQPRETIVWIATNDPTYLVLPLAVLTGISASVNSWLPQLPAVNTESPAGSLLFLMASGAAGGLLEVYLMAPVLRWVAKKWYPQAMTIDLRAALAWSKAPYLLPLPLTILIMFAALVFEVNGPSLATIMTTGGTSVSHDLVMYFGCGTAPLGIWVFVLNLVLVSEVLGSSKLEALGLQILAGLALLVPYLLIDAVFYAVYGLVFGTN